MAIKNLPKGKGIEHGALFWPTPLTYEHKILFSDTSFKKHYSDKMPDVGQSSGFVEPDLDYKDLPSFPEKLDFFIANHVLEHVEKPLSFFNLGYSLLKVGGVMMLTVPDAAKIYDKKRPRATLTDFLIAELDPCLARAKIFEYIIEVEKLTEEMNILDRHLNIVASNEDPHLWTFDRITFQLVISQMIDRLGSNMKIKDSYYNNEFEEITLFIERIS